MAAAEQIHKVHNVGFKVIPLEADAHAAYLASLGRACPFAAALEFLQHFVALAGEDFAGRGQGHAVGGALQQGQL